MSCKSWMSCRERERPLGGWIWWHLSDQAKQMSRIVRILNIIKVEPKVILQMLNVPLVQNLVHFVDRMFRILWRTKIFPRRLNPLCGRAWWQLRGRRGSSCVESSSPRARRPEKRLLSKLPKVVLERIGYILTSKNLWLADLINASVLSKSIVTYPFAFVPAAQFEWFTLSQWKWLCSKFSTLDTYCWRAGKICLISGGGQFGSRCCSWESWSLRKCQHFK